MKEFFRKIINKKYFHICMILVIVVIILFILGVIALKYNVEGETNMPFNLSKIIVISSSEGMDKESIDNKWAFDVNQNNDIFLYIEKNKNYRKEELIRTVKIDNINVSKNIEKGEIKLFKPNSISSGSMFTSKEEDVFETLEYDGDINSNMQQLKISNQGGVISFRCCNYKIAEYLSNDDEIQFNNLLKNCNIIEDDLKVKITFDVTINIESGKEYQANIPLDLAVENIVEQGTASREITNLDNIVFKRIKN